MRRGIANLPLHGGRAPRWLFDRMTRLAREIVVFMVSEFGAHEVLRRLSDPFWFQAFGCVLGFDWHSSGVTTTVCGALKEGLKDLQDELGLYVAGGKGRASRRTPDEITARAEKLSIDADSLIYASRMSAKVDNTALQDGFTLYHHTFLFTEDGKWAVVQQGMNEETGYARRYHWLSDGVESFVNEPHSAVCSDKKVKPLNLVAQKSGPAREVIAELAKEKPEKIALEVARIQELTLPAKHPVDLSDLRPDSVKKVLLKTYEIQPENFEQLLGIRGVGPKAIRALSLVSELVYGVRPSYEDPARYSFAHGGKDGYPYPVDRETYDKTIEFFATALNASRLDRSEKLKAFKRLSRLS